MRFISWNVNGLRACVQKGFLDFFNHSNADFFCLQETKVQEGQIQLDLPGYHQYWCYAEKKGYSGTAIFAKHEPQNVSYGIGVEELDTEGRVITLEYPEFYLVTCYTPNAQRELARIDHRMKWEEAFLAYLKKLDGVKPVVLCGDLNVAHQEIDLKNPKANRGSAGFSDQEREAFTRLLESGFTDTFRHLHPTQTGAYTWWSYMFNARKNNAGWRIDYFIVSERIRDKIFAAPIHADVMGSDHCPVELDLDISCNGGIWWSSEEQQQPDTPAMEIKEKKEPVQVPSSLKVHPILLIAILAVGILVGSFIHLGGSGDDFSRWFSIHYADSFLYFEDSSAIIDVSGQSYMPLTDGSETWLLKSWFFLEGSKFQTSDIEKAPWWIRLDLTDEAAIRMETDPLNLSCMVTDQQLTDRQIACIPWYKEDMSMGGYFLFGGQQESVELLLRLQQRDNEANSETNIVMEDLVLKTLWTQSIGPGALGFSETFSDWFSVEVLENRLSAADPGIFKEDNPLGVVNAEFTDGERVWIIQSAPSEFNTRIDKGSWWIRLELTEYGKQQFSKYPDGKLSLTDLTLGFTDDIFISSGLTSSLRPYIGRFIVPWYSQEHELAGFFVYGAESSPSSFGLSIVFQQSENADPLFITNETMTPKVVMGAQFGDWFSMVTQFYDRPEKITTIDKGDLVGMTVYEIGSKTLYLPYVYMMTPPGEERKAIEEATWWIRLNLTEYGKEQYKLLENKYELTAEDLGAPIYGGTTTPDVGADSGEYITILKWYDQDGDLGGYLLCGMKEQSFLMGMRLLQYANAQINELCSFTFYVAPEITIYDVPVGE